MNSYIYKNIYFMNSYLTFTENKIPIYLSSRTVKFKMYSNFDKLLDATKFVISESRKSLNLNIIYEASFVMDGYELEITKTKINLTGSSERAIRYGIKVLNSLATENKLPLIHIFDKPSFKYRGIIEGYYGEPWTYDSRLDLVSFMDEARLNTYMYAPKNDPYHRVKWDELYPSNELKKLINFKNLLFENSIDFYYCLSPGYTKGGGKIFEYTKTEDFEILFKKLTQVINEGVCKFGLLLDDIDYKLADENLKKFKRPGIAHAYICNTVYDFLKASVIDLDFVMCPTEYHQIGESEYRNDLKNLLNQNIKVFWTGDNVCAEVITTKDIELTKAALNHDIFIWENFPVADFTYGVRQYTAPLINRSDDLCEYASGYIINPMNLYEISKVAMITEADYAWNSKKYDSEKSFEFALKKIGLDFYNASVSYINYNYPSVLSHGNLSLEQQMNNEEILKYINDVSTSAKNMLKLDLPIINELKPWLERTIQEEVIIKKILDESIEKQELLKFLENIKFSGSEILDNLIKKYELLSNEEYDLLIKKRRGNQWYRVWEEKR